MYHLIQAIVAALVISAASAQSTQVSVSSQHDLSGPTLGLQGPTASQAQYNDHDGLKLGGTINDFLGPPIKIANGFHNMMQGSGMGVAGSAMGGGLRQGQAVLGVDANLLESAGNAKLFKGGALMAGALAKKKKAGLIGGPAGKMIASIVEIPIKVVAMKDIVAGKTLLNMANAKRPAGQNSEGQSTKGQPQQQQQVVEVPQQQIQQQEQLHYETKGQQQQQGHLETKGQQQQQQMLSSKGQSLMQAGQALKSHGMNQMMQGAQEGVQNIGNIFQKTADNVNSAIKLLPIIMDMQNQQQLHQSDATKGQQQQQPIKSAPHQMMGPGSISGGSLFGGLSSLLPGLGAGSDLGATSGSGTMQPFGNLFGANPSGSHPLYAAVMTNNSPLTSLLTRPGANAFLFPMTSASNSGAQSASYNYSLFPGVKVSETMSSKMPAPLASTFGGQQHQETVKV